jgi:hypothetical protein
MQFIDSLPKCNDWYYVLGVDLGFNDATSFSIIASSFKLKEAFCVYCDKDTEMDLTDTANMIKSLKEKFPLTRIIVDGANKQGIEEMKNRLNLPEIEIAEKQGKATFLRLLKDDVVIGGIKFIKDICSMLEEEWKDLMWLSKKGVKLEIEDPRCQNHLSDATLYAWRHTYGYLGRLESIIPKTGTEEFRMYEAKKMEDQDEESINEEKNYFGTASTDELFS